MELDKINEFICNENISLGTDGQYFRVNKFGVKERNVQLKINIPEV